MAAKRKTERPESEGVAVRVDQPRNPRYADGVPVRVTTTDVPEQTAGTKNGHSAGNEEK